VSTNQHADISAKRAGFREQTQSKLAASCTSTFADAMTDQSTFGTITGFGANRVIQALEAQLADMRGCPQWKAAEWTTLTNLALDFLCGELEMILASRLHHKAEITNVLYLALRLQQAASAGGLQVREKPKWRKSCQRRSKCR